MGFTKCKKTDIPRIRQELVAKQNGVCPICGKDLTRVKSENVVVDHDHKTGVIRAAVHRGCNGLEGKVLRLVRTWGKASSLRQCIDTLTNVIKFWELHKKPQTDLIYYSHMSPTEKRLALNKKRRLKAKVVREAKKKLKGL